MDITPTLLTFARAIGFKTENIIGRTLQERGASPLAVFALHKYALLPAIIWALIFINPSDIARIIDAPAILAWVILGPIVWNIQVFLAYYILNSTSSLASLAAIQALFSLPLILLVGVFFNGDSPNVFSVLAIVILVIGLLIKPSPHRDNKRPSYSRPLYLIIGVVVIRTLLEAFGFGFGRELAQFLSPEVYLGTFSVLALGLCAIWTHFLSLSKQDTKIFTANKGLVIAIPVLWFAASIPEFFAVAVLPIYVIAAVNALTFGMDVGSDVVQKRLRINIHTLSFLACITAGVVLAVLSQL